MSRFAILQLGLLLVAAAGWGVGSLVWGAKDPPPDTRAQAQKQMDEGNFKDAYALFRENCLHEKTDPKLVGQDLTRGVQCLRNLGRTTEVDEYVESTLAAHAKNWRLLQAAADVYLTVDHYGSLVAGKFERGPHRGDSRVVNAQERDRIRALQLLNTALPLANQDDDKPAVAQFYLSLAQQLLYYRSYNEAWRLQSLSNLTELPDYEEGYYYERQYNGAPVDADGRPVFHQQPKSWEAATTDGERWRWALAQAVENAPALLNQVRYEQATFYQNQFGPESMNFWGLGRFFGLPMSDDDTKQNESGTYALHTLKETETIAKLATGIKRFELPDEFNYLRILQAIADNPATGYGDEALQALAHAFENRRQFTTAAKLWKRSIKEYGAAADSWKQARVAQIEGNWGRFEPLTTQPAGQGATVDFRFRNATDVSFDAQAIKVDALLNDVKAYLKSDPGQLNWEQLNIDNIGYRLVEKNEQKYLGDKVAQWKLPLVPRAGHFDKRVTVATPLQKAGAYLVTATVEGGNVSKIILWVADTAIVHKHLSDQNYYYIADAAGGEPIAGANLEFF
ncbi:MAG TPA: alpha-2-macroglobulin, partial [Pirellulaceae bacterium]|nr:alpha-2-macroglobulin [Pirellulaceae bacterium]